LNIGVVFFYFYFWIQLFYFIFFLLSGVFIVEDLTSRSIVDVILRHPLSSESFVALFIYTFSLPHAYCQFSASFVNTRQCSIVNAVLSTSLTFKYLAHRLLDLTSKTSYFSHTIRISSNQVRLLIHCYSYTSACNVARATIISALFTAFNCPTFIQILQVHSIFNVS
jgi:hypothetical protein